MRVPARALVLAGLLLMPLALAAHAPQHPSQPMVVEVEGYRGLLSPVGTTIASINLTVKIDCTQAQSDAPINFTVRDKPDWLFVQSMPGWRTVSSNYTGYSNNRCDPITGYLTVREPMRVNFTTYAPAYRFANFTVVVARAGVVKQAVGGIQPGYYGEVQVFAPPTVVRVTSQQSRADLPFRVRNLGNGETTVRLTYTFGPGIRVEAPDVLIIGANQQGGDWDKPLNVRVYIDDVRDDFTVSVNATGFSRNASNPRSATGGEATTTVDLQRQLPGGPLLIAAAGALAAAILTGRRRRA